MVGDRGGCGVHLVQAHFRRSGERQQYPASALHGHLQHRTRNRPLGRLEGSVVTTGRPDAHRSGTGAPHDRFDVCEIHIDQARSGDEIGDAADSLQEDVVGQLERIDDGQILVRQLEQPLVGDHDERVHRRADGLDALLRLNRATTALKPEGTGHYGDGQRFQAARDLGDYRSASGAGAATLAGRDEDHVGATECIFDLLAMRICGCTSDLGVGTGPQTSSEVTSDVELDVGVRHQQRLGVGVDCDKFDAAQSGIDHPVYGVYATAAYTDHFDDGEVAL